MTSTTSADELDDVPTAELKALAWLRLRMQSEAGCELKLLMEAEATSTGGSERESRLIEKEEIAEAISNF